MMSLPFASRSGRGLAASGLLLLALAVTSCVRAGSRPAPPRIGAVRVLSTPAGRFGRFEAALDLTTSAANPFDFDEVLMQGHFVSPAGKETVVDGFYTRDFKRALAGGAERVEPAGEPEWRVRFTPAESGRYRCWFTARDRGGAVRTPERGFTVGKSSAGPGFVRVSPVNHLYFETGDGAPYFAVGENVCWSGARGTYDFDRWFGRLAANGANYARLWIGPFDLFTLERQKRDPSDAAGLGRYDLAGAWRLDYVLRLAERGGIRLMLCAESFNSLHTGQFGEWPHNPYNAANGGMLHRPEEFFTNAEARRWFRNRLRYLVARYGGSPNVLSWELWNEVDGIDQYRGPNVRSWHAEMARYLKSIDPYHHPVTTSYGNSEGDPGVDGLPELDYVQTHNYDSRDIAEMAARYCLAKVRKYGKPHYLGEFGADVDGHADAADRAGTHLHNGLWAPLFSLSAGTGMLWWWDSYVDPQDLYHEFRPVARFVRGIPWNRLHWAPLAVPQLRFAKPPAHLPARDLVLDAGGASWEAAPFNQPTTFTVRRDGSVEPADRLSRVLHGLANHRNLHNPARFAVDYPEPGRFIVRVEGVSGYGGAKLVLRLDGRPVVERDMPDANPPGRHATLHQYDGPYAVEVPAGRHTLEAENTGRDWLFAGYEFTHYVTQSGPNLRVHALAGDGRLGLAWIKNRDNTWFRRAGGHTVEPVPPSVVTLQGLKDGTYRVEWWDTGRGTVTRTETARCASGRVSLAVPELPTDVACKLVRQ